MRPVRSLAAFLTLTPLLSVMAGVSELAAATRSTPGPQQFAQRVEMSLEQELFPQSSALAPRCSDATFLRRVWLDVAGDIPTAEEFVAFQRDDSPNKRRRVIRELLDSPQYGLNWARYWRDVIFYRRIEDRALIAADALETDLSQWLNENAPWNEIAAKFVTATGDVRENGATAVIMAQQGRTEETTAEIARIFLGMQIQCAQCHDHPYDSWKREQFHELAAFFPRIGVRPVRTETRRSFEVIVNDRPFRFVKNDDGARPMPEHLMPDLDDPSAPGTRMQPKFFLTGADLPFGSPDAQRRETLAHWLTDNEWFAVAMVNRMWAELVGEGFYEPVDDLGPDREPRARETLELLADGFRESGYDVKWLIETICLTDAYQRESRPRAVDEEHLPFTASAPQPLRGDQLYNALLTALDLPEDIPQRGQGRGAFARGGSRRLQFNTVFGYDPSEPRDTIVSSIPQTLAMMNSPALAGALKVNRRGMLTDMLTRHPDDEQLATELYLRTLSREPTEDELARVQAYLDEVGNRKAAFEDLAWALINSAEFRYRR